MSVTSDEVNYLIYRYLQESGFSHSSFAFGHESHILKNDYKNVKVAPGALISLLQKGLLYAESEAHISEDGTERDCSRPFSLLQPHECEKSSGKRSTKSSELRRSQLLQPSQPINIAPGASTTSNKQSNKKSTKDEDRMELDSTDNTKKSTTAGKEISTSDVLQLTGHQSEVFNCEWNPVNPSVLASGSGDATARVWRIPAVVNSKSDFSDPIVFRHDDSLTLEQTQQQQKDVTAVNWNPQGTLLATGSYMGDARIWSVDESGAIGRLSHTLTKHKGPIFSLKWNEKGSMLLSGGVDKTVIAWDATNGQVRQIFENHSSPVLEVDWMNDETFASCSTDKNIFVCRLGSGSDQQQNYIRRFTGHTHEVNAIKWCPRGLLLASCSDDKTAKIWKLDSDRWVKDLREHEKEIYTIEWSPCGSGSKNPNRDLLLATASFDNTIKLWDPETGKCVNDLSKHHSQAVYSIAFSPDGRYLASGSFDSRVNIWNVKDGSLIRTYRSAGGVFDVAWNCEGDRIAASLSNNTICVFDFKQ